MGGAAACSAAHFFDGALMRRPLVAGNWKLNGSRAANAELLDAIRVGLQPDWRCDVMVCPPFVYLAEVCAALAGSGRFWSVPRTHRQSRSGAFTGEVSAAMLRDVGCTHVIVGHSERRALYGESDAVVTRKFQAFSAAGLQPILCVGETLQERQSGITEEVVTRQLNAVLDQVAVEDIRAQRGRLRAGLGHRDGPDGNARAGAGRACADPGHRCGAGC